MQYTNVTHAGAACSDIMNYIHSVSGMLSFDTRTFSTDWNEIIGPYKAYLTFENPAV